jgi:uncharacterized protein
MDITVTDNPDRRRFEIRLAGELVGFADYEVRDEVVAFTHTEIDPAHRRKGLGAALVGAALDQVRADGRTARPLCWFVADYIDGNPAYADLRAR